MTNNPQAGRYWCCSADFGQHDENCPNKEAESPVSGERCSHKTHDVDGYCLTCGELAKAVWCESGHTVPAPEGKGMSASDFLGPCWPQECERMDENQLKWVFKFAEAFKEHSLAAVRNERDYYKQMDLNEADRAATLDIELSAAQEREREFELIIRDRKAMYEQEYGFIDTATHTTKPEDVEGEAARKAVERWGECIWMLGRLTDATLPGKGE